MRSSLTPVSRAAAVSVTTLALAAALVGCGSDAKSESTSDPTPSETAAAVKVLTDPEAASVLLTERNLGNKFTLDTAESSSDSPGCLAGFEKVLGDASPAKAEAENDYYFTESESYPRVGSKVLSFESDEAAESAMKALADEFEDCSAVRETDDDGYTYALNVQSDDEKTVDDVDDEFNLVATGTISNSSGTGDASLVAAVVRIGNNLVAVNGVTIDSQLPGPLKDILEIIADRLVAVADGKAPDESAVAGA